MRAHDADRRVLVLPNQLRGLRAQVQLSKLEADRAAWAFERDGTRYEGVAAVQRVLRELPRWRWLARLMALPVLRAFAAWTYDWVVRNRGRLRVFRAQPECARPHANCVPEGEERPTGDERLNGQPSAPPQDDDILMAQDDVAIRAMRDEMQDYALMAKWLTDERVLAFYDGRDNPSPLERILTDFSVQALAAERTTPYFILYRAQPIGYAQLYAQNAEENRAYDLDEHLKAVGVDTFIGEPQYWNQGLGTRAIALILRYIFEALGADVVTIDPETWNTRAIHVYEKCGFRKIKVLPQHELHEGEWRDSWLMTITRAEFDAQRNTDE